jgi:hypothetical protein
MKLTDPLDQKIDERLKSLPIQTSDNFAARTLAELDAETKGKKPGKLAPLIRFALPMAAALALAFIAYAQFGRDGAEKPTAATGSHEDLNQYEIQEIFLLQEGLSRFAQIDAGELSQTDELLDTLETLYSI